MKLIVLFLFCSLVTSVSFSQKLSSGVYIFKYCDYEYNKCLTTCKVIIKRNKIYLYTLNGLSVPNGTLLDSGIILKNKSAKWIIGKTKADRYKKAGDYEKGLVEIDFKTKKVWQF